jgi:hypothetical protein
LQSAFLKAAVGTPKNCIAPKQSLIIDARDPLLTVANDRFREPKIGNSKELVTPKMVVAQRLNYEMTAISLSTLQFSFST